MAEFAVVNVDGFKDLSKLLQTTSKATKRKLNKGLKAGVDQTVVPDAKAAASWSSRIPNTIKSSVTMTGVFVKAGGPDAPHAAAYETGSASNPGYIRHPVFGNREVWVETASRPYIRPAIAKDITAVAEAVAQAVADLGP